VWWHQATQENKEDKCGSVASDAEEFAKPITRATYMHVCAVWWHQATQGNKKRKRKEEQDRKGHRVQPVKHTNNGRSYSSTEY